MNIDELDDPRAKEAIRAAVRVAEAGLEHKRMATSWARAVKEYGSRSEEAARERTNASKASRDFERLLDAYQEIRAELGKHEQVVYYAEPPGKKKSEPPAEAER